MIGAIIFIALASTSSGHLEALSDEITNRISLTKCISAATNSYFKESEIITVSVAVPRFEGVAHIEFERMLLEEMYSRVKWAILVKNAGSAFAGRTNSRLETKKSDGYIVYIRSLDEVPITLKNLKEHPSWNPHAKFIVVSVYFQDNQRAVVSFLTQQLWGLDILNGVILLPADDNTFYNVYSWYPFGNGACGNDFNRFDNITTCHFGEMEEKVNWFANRVPNNLNGCPVKIRTLVYPPFINEPEGKVEDREDEYLFDKGLEINILNMAANVANFEPRYSMSGNPEDWGEIKSNRGTGIIGTLMDGIMDIGVGALSPNIDRHAILDSTSPYFEDSIGFCVPHSEEKGEWKKFFKIMSLAVWMGIIITIIIIVRITLVLSEKYPESTAYSSYPNIVQKVFAMFLGNSVNRQPRTSPVRWFLMLWMIFSLHLDTAYQTYLMSSLTEPDFEPQIKTLEEILSSNKVMLFLESSRRYFHGSNDSNTQAILERWVSCSDLDMCLERTAYRKDCVITASRLYTDYAKDGYKGKKGQPLLYCFKHNIVTYPVVMYMRTGFPLRNRINDIIRRINAAGFITYWETKLFAQKLINASLDESDEQVFLTMGHLDTIFIVLGIGIGVSILAFIIEILYYTYYEHEKWQFIN